MGLMSFPDPTPRRLSDTERDAAVAALRTHLAAGRLDAAEFEERMQAALAGRYASDVMPLFSDLPEPRPAYLGETAQPTWNTYPTAGRSPEPGAPQPYGAPGGYAGGHTSGALVPRSATPPPVPRSETDRIIDVVQAVVWPVAIALLIFANTGIWPIIVAIIVSSVLGGYKGQQRRRRQPPPY